MHVAPWTVFPVSLPVVLPELNEWTDSSHQNTFHLFVLSLAILFSAFFYLNFFLSMKHSSTHSSKTWIMGHTIVAEIKCRRFVCWLVCLSSLAMGKAWQVQFGWWHYLPEKNQRDELWLGVLFYPPRISKSLNNANMSSHLTAHCFYNKPTHS